MLVSEKVHLGGAVPLAIQLQLPCLTMRSNDHQPRYTHFQTRNRSGSFPDPAHPLHLLYHCFSHLCYDIAVARQH